MRVKSNLIVLMCFVLFFGMPVFAQSNMSVQELKDQYSWYNRIANNPDIFWIIETGDDSAGFVSRERFDEIMIESIAILGETTLEQKAAIVTHHVNASQRVKADLRNNLLPNLEVLIRERANSPNPNINLNDGTEHYADDTSLSGLSFVDVVKNISSDENLADVSFVDFMSELSSDENLAAVSFTDYINGESADGTSSGQCPELNPGNQRKNKFNNSGNGSYLQCNYFQDGKLEYQCPFKNGNKDGIQFSFRSQQPHLLGSLQPYMNGDLHGAVENWTVDAKSGHHWQSSKQEYSNGKMHGEKISYRQNGTFRYSFMYNQGEQTTSCHYHEDGSLIRCKTLD